MINAMAGATFRFYAELNDLLPRECRQRDIAPAGALCVGLERAMTRRATRDERPGLSAATIGVS